MQHRLKVLCAQVRNEYSKLRLNHDFGQGLKDLYEKDPQENERIPTKEDCAPKQLAIPSIEVFCVSANDYMKIVRVKSSCDGPPKTLLEADHTQIPLVRKFVHETTKRKSKEFMRNFVQATEDALEKLSLFASGHKFAVAYEATATSLKASFEFELKQIDASILEVSTTFEKAMRSGVETKLFPTLSSGSKKKSIKVAISTIESWV